MHEDRPSRFPALLSVASLTVLSAACGLFPSVSVYPTNAGRAPEYAPLPNATATITADTLAGGTLKPFCEVRGGKTVRDEAALAKVTAAVAEWRRVNKKTPPKPAPPPAAKNPNQPPVDVSAKGVSVSPGALLGLSPSVPGPPDTAHDPSWFALTCGTDRITTTVVDKDIDLDAVFLHEDPASSQLMLAGYSLKTKAVLMAKMALKAPARRGQSDATEVYAYDLSRYLTGKVDATTARYDTRPNVVPADGNFHLYFLDPGSSSGLEVEGGRNGSGETASVARFTVASAP